MSSRIIKNLVVASGAGGMGKQWLHFAISCNRSPDKSTQLRNIKTMLFNTTVNVLMLDFLLIELKKNGQT